MTTPALASDFNGQEGTFLCWFTLEDFDGSGASGSGGTQLIYIKSTVSGNNNTVGVTFADTGELQAYYYTGATEKYIIDSDFIEVGSDGYFIAQEHFVAVTWSLSTGAGQLSLYRDGVLIETISDIGTWGTTMPTYFKATMGPGAFTARHIGIWSKALTSAQINQIYGASQADNVEFIPELGSTAAKIRLINPSGADMYLTSLTINGKRIKAYKPLICRAFDENTIGQYGRPGVVTMTIDMPYQDDAAAGKAYSEYLLNRFKNPMNAVESITFSANKNDYLEEKAMKLKIGSRISLQETQSGLNGSFFVNGIEYVQSEGRLDATLYLQSEDNVYWLIGTAGYSEIGVTTLVGF